MLRICFVALTLTPLPLFGGSIGFNRDIRPLLNEHCFKCHGGVKEAGGLNLQFREQALQAGETGEIAIVPGKPDESAFIERLETKEADDRMPRKGPPLPPEKIAMLRQWIAEGAKWEDHWAYVPPRGNGKPMDAIVEERLKSQGLSFSPLADVRTLARRLSLDLVGLPPEADRVDAIANAADPEAALTTFTEELLDSPAYGERWAVPWLDLARYADSKGYESDRFRDMWRYRDWVVDALNADMPYDRFVTEQLAGDLIPNASSEQLIATAYHRNTPQNDEGGTDDEEFRTYAIIDRVNATFDALQGTSIGCVQCHGHPYDPFVHKEYYQLMAFLNNTADADRDDQAPTRKTPGRADAARWDQLRADLAQAKEKLAAEKEQQSGPYQKWLDRLKPGTPPSLHLEKPVVTASAGTLEVQDDQRILLKAPLPPRSTIQVKLKPEPGKLDSFVLEVIPDESLPNRGPGTGQGNGNFILSYISATIVADGRATPIAIGSASATFEQPGWPVAEALRRGEGIKGEGESGWAIAGGTGRPQSARFKLTNLIEVPANGELEVTLECENEHWLNHVLGSFRITAVGPESVSPELAALPQDLQAIAQRDAKSWKPEEQARLEQHFLSNNSITASALYRQVSDLEASIAAIPVADLPIMQELTGTAARVTKVFHRGNWMDKTDVVEPKTPTILNAWHDEYPRNRLGLAKWLTNGENPLTARVQVNRVWEQLFGVGLVETLEDFGSQGDKPVYQDLLDELAVRFQGEMKWSQKALLREIVHSRVYRQSAKVTSALLERDPANRLLARGPRFRLSSEQLRDQALALGGILSRKMGGPPVMPYQPPGTWLVPYEGRDWTTSAGEDSRRRALYTFIRRSATYPSMVTFDAPNREFCVVRRIRTNTPLQALDQLNSPVFMEAAEGLAKRMTAASERLPEQIARGLVIATQRPARDHEITALTKLHERTGGNLILVANAILNLDEVLTKN